MGRPCTPACWTRVACVVCRKTKAPSGRSVALECVTSYCGDHCPGYRQDPKPPHLWHEHDSDRAYTDPVGWYNHVKECERCRED